MIRALPVRVGLICPEASSRISFLIARISLYRRDRRPRLQPEPAPQPTQRAVMTSKLDLGDRLYELVSSARAQIFEIGEVSQLAFVAFSKIAADIADGSEETIDVRFPIGVRGDGSIMMSTTAPRSKEHLVARYAHIGNTFMPLNGIYSLVTTTEAMFGDVCRTLIVAYPKKVGAKRTISLASLSDASDLESVLLSAADTVWHELSYKSPREFAESFEQVSTVNLLEIPAYHRYIEVKATRDIHIHNRGVANHLYLAKSVGSARVHSGEELIVDNTYFLASYEACLQVADALEASLDDQWPSPKREADRAETQRRTTAEEV